MVTNDAAVTFVDGFRDEMQSKRPCYQQNTRAVSLIARVKVKNKRTVGVTGEDDRLVTTPEHAVHVRDRDVGALAWWRGDQGEVTVRSEHVHRSRRVSDGEVPGQFVFSPLRHDGERGDVRVDLDRGDEAEVVVPRVASPGHRAVLPSVEVRRG